jgi:hypothetical protein
VDIKIGDNVVELYHREEVLWTQRACIQWLKEGDKNSKFFHQRARMRRRSNLVISLTKPDGKVTKDVFEMQNMASEFYKNLYGSSNMFLGKSRR